MNVTARKGYLKVGDGGKPVVAKQVGRSIHINIAGVVAMPDAEQAVGLLCKQVGVPKRDFDTAFGHMLPQKNSRGPLRKNSRDRQVKIGVAKGHIEVVDRESGELLALMDEDRHPETQVPCVMIAVDPEGKPPRWRSATTAAKFWADMGYSDETFGMAFGKMLTAEKAARARKARRRTSRRA